MNLIITGGYGFIGSALIRHLLDNTDYNILNIDKLTYASNSENLKGFEGNKKYQFVKADICDFEVVSQVFKNFNPSGIIHLAAESHVDRSIDSPRDFINTNILGTYNLLEVSLEFYNSLPNNNFLFHHVSTDEVYGDLGKTDNPFTENNSYKPSSPYSASKASSDHLVKSWNRTFGLPVVISNCSNNFGPYQSLEKLIPLIISNALQGLSLPVYGDGSQIRDWLYVDDHITGILSIFNSGKVGETYNIGGNEEKTNIEVVRAICKHLDSLIAQKPKNIKSFLELIEFVKDRPGHDCRYAIDSTKISSATGWSPKESFETGIEKTILWYIDNIDIYRNTKNELTKRRGSRMQKEI